MPSQVPRLPKESLWLWAALGGFETRGAFNVRKVTTTGLTTGVRTTTSDFHISKASKCILRPSGCFPRLKEMPWSPKTWVGQWRDNKRSLIKDKRLWMMTSSALSTQSCTRKFLLPLCCIKAVSKVIQPRRFLSFQYFFLYFFLCFYLFL